MAALFLAAGILITYTLVPLPGQRSLGDVNYVIALVFFVANMLFVRIYRLLMLHRRRRERAVP